MSTQIQYKSGDYYRFIATRGFALGSSGQTIIEGAEVLFDGTHIVHDGNTPMPMPQLRGAVKAGWLVLAEDYDPEDQSAYIPKSAGIMLRPAKGGNPMETPKRVAVTTVEAEESEVTDIQQHSQKTRDHNAVRQNKQGRRTGSVEVESQEGTVVRVLTNPAKQDANLEHTSADEYIRRAEKIKIVPGKGRTRSEMLDDMDPEAREEYLAKIASSKATKDIYEEPKVVARVGKPKNQDKEGFHIVNSVKAGSTEIADLSSASGPVETTVGESEGIRFTGTYLAKPKVVAKPVKVNVVAVADSRRKIAKSICADFPDNYNFDASPKQKIARLQADYEDRPDVIRAVAAAEMDAVVRGRLVEEFPEAFE